MVERTLLGRGADHRPVLRFEPNGHADGTWPAGLPAVDQVLREGFEVTPGVTLLLGENGAGKSTLVAATSGTTRAVPIRACTR